MAEQIVQSVQATGLADILERILDKGLVIVGDIKVNLTDIELLTIKSACWSLRWNAPKRSA